MTDSKYVCWPSMGVVWWWKVDGLTQNGHREGCFSASFKGKNLSISRLNERSKKSVFIKFVSMVKESPSVLNRAIISFLILSIFGPLALVYYCYIYIYIYIYILYIYIYMYVYIAYIYIYRYIYLYIYIYIQLNRNSRDAI